MCYNKRIIYEDYFIMKILITNDDGIDALGLKTLAKTLSCVCDVFVCAPKRERSGNSHSLTIHGVLREPEEFNIGSFPAWALDGTPADCVKFALDRLLDKKPDFVVSGINRGPNNAANILYSGTVGGAMEGAASGIPSLAISLAEYHCEEYAPGADFAGKFLSWLSKNNMREAAVYNINVPALSRDKIKGVKFTKMSTWQYLPTYEKRTDPFGKNYYWSAGFSMPNSMPEGSDDDALLGGYISVTPLKVDRTDYRLLDGLNAAENKPCF